MYVFHVPLADTNRSVNETLTIRAARHPSETAIMVRDLTGVVQACIEVGSPDAERLRRTAKAARHSPGSWRKGVWREIKERFMDQGVAEIRVNLRFIAN